MPRQRQGTPFYSLPSRSGYRLIEIPPEIETLLERPDAPALCLEPGQDDMATLKSPDHTYKLKQRNTSNGLFLIKPYTPPPHGASSSSSSSSPSSSSSSRPGIAFITILHESVELERVHPRNSNDPIPRRGKWHEKFGSNR